MCVYSQMQPDIHILNSYEFLNAAFNHKQIAWLLLQKNATDVEARKVNFNPTQVTNSISLIVFS